MLTRLQELSIGVQIVFFPWINNEVIHRYVVLCEVGKTFRVKLWSKANISLRLWLTVCRSVMLSNITHLKNNALNLSNGNGLLVLHNFVRVLFIYVSRSPGCGFTMTSPSRDIQCIAIWLTIWVVVESSQSCLRVDFFSWPIEIVFLFGYF